MERLGEFEILEELGRGGMGVVYKARQPRLQRTVAIKQLHADAPEVTRRRFQREAEALALLHHPHVVNVFQVDEAAGQPYLVLEFVEGAALGDRLERDGPLPEREAARIALELADAVDHAHAAGILHRDLKPDNVLLDAQGRVKLTDFGITRELDPSASRSALTRRGSLLGTPGYAAPEQLSGEVGQAGTATDVYGLGATLYALLTGQPPIRGVSLAEVLVATAERPPEPPSLLRPGTSPELEAICLACLAKPPLERPLLRELIERLAAWLGLAAPTAPTHREPLRLDFDDPEAPTLLLRAGEADASGSARLADDQSTRRGGLIPPDEAPTRRGGLIPPDPDEEPTRRGGLIPPDPDEEPTRRGGLIPPDPEEEPTRGGTVIPPEVAEAPTRRGRLTEPDPAPAPTRRPEPDAPAEEAGGPEAQPGVGRLDLLVGASWGGFVALSLTPVTVLLGGPALLDPLRLGGGTLLAIARAGLTLCAGATILVLLAHHLRGAPPRTRLRPFERAVTTAIPSWIATLAVVCLPLPTPVMLLAAATCGLLMPWGLSLRLNAKRPSTAADAYKMYLAGAVAGFIAGAIVASACAELELLPRDVLSAAVIPTATVGGSVLGVWASYRVSAW